MTIGLARVYGYSISRVPTTLCSMRAFQEKCSKTGYPVRRKQLAGPSRGLERAVYRHRRKEAIRCRMSRYRPRSRTATLPNRSPAVVDRFVLSTRVHRRQPTKRALSSALDRAMRPFNCGKVGNPPRLSAFLFRRAPSPDAEAPRKEPMMYDRERWPEQRASTGLPVGIMLLSALAITAYLAVGGAFSDGGDRAVVYIPQIIGK